MQPKWRGWEMEDCWNGTMMTRIILDHLHMLMQKRVHSNVLVTIALIHRSGAILVMKEFYLDCIIYDIKC